MKKIALFLTLLAIFFFQANTVSARIFVADESSQIRIGVQDSDYRVLRLKKYLQSQNSPLVPYVEDFVKAANKYDLDWRLVAAIAGVESSFGKKVPANSYNAYGWASGIYRFNSWEDSIEVVSKSLKEDYIDRGATSIWKIGRRYCPPNPAWASKVKFFMDKIETLPLAFDLEG